MQKLILMRHGETAFNLSQRYQGRIDVELNEAGILQARSVAERLMTFGIDRVITSPLRRAAQTAEIIAVRLHLPLSLEEDLSERNMGVFEGLTLQEVQERFPQYGDMHMTHQMFAAPPGGESLYDVTLRVHRRIEQLRAELPGQRVLLVSHGGVARSLHGLYRRVPDAALFNYRLGNCETDVFDFQ